MNHPALLRTNEKGLTLIELLLVMAVISIISTVSILSFVSYNRRQMVTNAASDLYASLSSAKSRAQSQLKPLGAGYCTEGVDELKGYKVKIYSQDTSPSCSGEGTGCSEVFVMCGSKEISLGPSSIKNLPSGVTVPSNINIMFHVLSGSVTEGDGVQVPLSQSGKSIQLSNGDMTRTIIIYPDGRITSSE